MTTEERLHDIASIFGKEQEAETLITNLNNKVEESKKTLADAGILDKTISIVEGGLKGMVIVESKQFGRGSQAVYEYLGMKAPEVVQKKSTWFRTRQAPRSPWKSFLNILETMCFARYMKGQIT